MAGTDVGFAVIYRWSIREDKIEQFQEAWEKVTAAIEKSHHPVLLNPVRDRLA